MNGGNPRRTSLAPLASPCCFALFRIGVEREGFFKLPGDGRDHFHLPSTVCSEAEVCTKVLAILPSVAALAFRGFTSKWPFSLCCVGNCMPQGVENRALPKCSTASQPQSLAIFESQTKSQGISAARSKFGHFHRRMYRNRNGIVTAEKSQPISQKHRCIQFDRVNESQASTANHRRETVHFGPY